jgi:phosphoribosylglycinamide formyltransferase-1
MKIQKKNNFRCIFFGKKNDLQSLEAIKYLKKFYKKVEVILNENIIGEKLDFKKYKGYDLVFSFKTKIIFPEYFLKSTKLYNINFHPALPKYPGSGGGAWAILNNDKYSGVTVHFINNKIDNGRIILVKKFKIKKKINITEILNINNENQLKVFKHVVVNLFKKNWLKNQLKKKEYKWNTRDIKIVKLNKIRKIDKNISKEKLSKIIRATNYKQFKPYIQLHGYKFYLS